MQKKRSCYRIIIFNDFLGRWAGASNLHQGLSSPLQCHINTLIDTCPYACCELIEVCYDSCPEGLTQIGRFIGTVCSGSRLERDNVFRFPEAFLIPG
jgi:hypothetical protein